MQILSGTVYNFFGGEKCLEPHLPEVLKNKENHRFVTTAKHSSSKEFPCTLLVMLLEFCLTSDDLHVYPQFVAIFQQEVLSKQFRISCDN